MLAAGVLCDISEAPKSGRGILPRFLPLTADQDEILDDLFARAIDPGAALTLDDLVEGVLRLLPGGS